MNRLKKRCDETSNPPLKTFGQKYPHESTAVGKNKLTLGACGPTSRSSVVQSFRTRRVVSLTVRQWSELTIRDGRFGAQ